MDEFVNDLMEQVFTKGEKEYAFDEETRQLMNKIRQKIKDSPRHQISSGNTNEYIDNLQQRVFECISVENDVEKKAVIIKQYLEIINNKKVIQSLCG